MDNISQVRDALERARKQNATLTAQVETQKDRLGILLQHLSHHHDELGQTTAEQCTWLQKQWAEEASGADSDRPAEVGR